VRLLGSPLNCRVAPATRLRQRLEKEKKPRRVTGRKAVVASPGPSFCLAAGRGAWTRFQSPNKCSIMRAGAERASAVKRGANLIKITDVTGHRSLEMLKTYSRDAEAFVGHAGAGLL